MSIKKEELQKLLEEELEEEKKRYEKACVDEAKIIKDKADSRKRVEALECLLKKHEQDEKPKLEQLDLTSSTRFNIPLRFKSKTVSDASFLILKEVSEPMSTGEIWEKLKEGGKNVVKPAVGMALRNDKRFKLVGRGVFTLANEQEEIKKQTGLFDLNKSAGVE